MPRPGTRLSGRGERDEMSGSATTNVDMVVAGAGAAGLVAALAGAQSGLSVLLADANPAFREGCTTVQSTSMIPAAGSRWQHKAGIDDSAERFRADVDRKTHGRADPVVARTLTEIGPELVEWLADDCGVPLELAVDVPYPGHSRPRCHCVPDRSGRTLHQRLLAAVSAEDRIELIAPRRLVGVEPDAGDGALVSELAAPGSEPEQLSSAAVVLATGGFAANPELVRRHIPEIADALYFGGEGSVGDALAIGRCLDADTACLDAYQGHGSVATPHGVLMTWAAVGHGAILVNVAGERFGDESTGYSEYARIVLSQPDGTAWMVFDRRIDAACRAFADYQRCLELGAVREALDVDALAALIGAPASALADTLARAGDPASDPFGRTDWEAPLTPPYAAVKVTGALFHTQGGLSVDGDATVLAGRRRIEGLYAAGGAAVGMSGRGPDGYLAGNGLLAALGLGYVAGRHAARLAKARSQ